MGAQSAEQVLAMLEEMVGDDEIQRAVRDAVQCLAAVDDVGLDQRPLGHLRIFLAQILEGMAVEVFHPRIGLHVERCAERGDPGSLTLDMAGEIGRASWREKGCRYG